MERRSSKTWVDRGQEFCNKDVQKLVELYSTENEEKSCLIERFNRTIMEKVIRNFSASNTLKYVDVLELLVNLYNKTIHSSKKCHRRKQVERKTKIKCGEIYIQNLMVRPWLQNFQLEIIFEKQRKNVFDKERTQRWTEEAFIISKIQLTTPAIFKITD